MTNLKKESLSPENIRWTLWSADSFDPGTPRRMEAEGKGLWKGLRALWQRHLSETVREDGSFGFTYFNLWLVNHHLSIAIKDDERDWAALRRSTAENPNILDAIAASQVKQVMKALLADRE